MHIINNKEIKQVAGGSALLITQKINIEGLPDICITNYFSAQNPVLNISFPMLTHEIATQCYQAGLGNPPYRITSTSDNIPVEVQLVP